MIKKIALAVVATVVAAIALLLAYAATRPDSFSVQRSTVIRAPADKIQPLIADLHRFNAWNPFNKKDPSIKLTYTGPASGRGAGFDFAGNSEVGQGRIVVVDAQPAKVTMTLDMTAPMAAHNNVEFTLTPQGDGTQVTWAMRGAQPFIGKLMGLVFNIDRMIGSEFEAGLADLKREAEKT